MDLVVPSSRLPGSNNSREFYEEIFVVHAGSGTFSVDDSQVKAGAGDIVIAPAGSAHRFVNSGPDRLRLTAIHHHSSFITEWLEPLTPEQRYWSTKS
jgi:mannose-6-phosphate isomerase-like protein (cupin superfamily)